MKEGQNKSLHTTPPQYNITCNFAKRIILVYLRECSVQFVQISFYF